MFFNVSLKELKYMEKSGKEEQSKNKFTEIRTFPVPFPLAENQENITIDTNILSKRSKEELINQAFKFHSQGKISKAKKYYQYLIGQGCNDHRVFSNYGGILKSQGKLNEAELSLHKAIELKPDFADAYSNLGIVLIDLGNLEEAESYVRKAIKFKSDYADAYSNLGYILLDKGELIEAELALRKAIELKPDFAIAHSNLGNVMTNLGKLKEAEVEFIKAIEIKSSLARAYYCLSNLNYSMDHKTWQDKLFSKNILNNKSPKDQVDIYFARANILHKNKNYDISAKYLKLANKVKLDIRPSDLKLRIHKSNLLFWESNKHDKEYKEHEKTPESIFIVGMPRSGSTLIESILSMNTSVNDLGESNILEELFLEKQKSKEGLTLSQLYFNKATIQKNKLNYITNKWLYNYQYSGIIATQISNSKIIHCFRNPLDNILSIFRSNFARGNDYASSLVDCARVYLDQEEIMTKYKKRFRLKIYDLNYDLLVRQPNQEIKSLISWLGWKWDNSYLSPHLNPRSVSTASSVQVRSPINSKSIGGWKNYKEMLEPAIEILIKTKKYRDLIS